MVEGLFANRANYDGFLSALTDAAQQGIRDIVIGHRDKSGTSRMALLRTVMFLTEAAASPNSLPDFRAGIETLSTSLTSAAAALAVVKYYSLVLVPLAQKYYTSPTRSTRARKYSQAWEMFANVVALISGNINLVLKSKPEVRFSLIFHRSCR